MSGKYRDKVGGYEKGKEESVRSSEREREERRWRK